ncbi:MAG: hypothetical protein PHS46_00055 [Candidatus Omnitrophica bacterium]|nr:hypothetical protein [Candidatus Omnitrophota bacterium]
MTRRNHVFNAGIVLAVFLLSTIFTSNSRGDGEVKGLRQYERWNNGTIRSCTLFDTNGLMKAKSFCRNDGTVEKVEKYDPSGNKIEEAFYDERGKLKTGIDGWSAMRWWYNGSHLESQISYDETGTPMERRIYSESGRLVQRQYRHDIDFNPYEEANMAMLLGPQNVPCTVERRPQHE